MVSTPSGPLKQSPYVGIANPAMVQIKAYAKERLTVASSARTIIAMATHVVSV